MSIDDGAFALFSPPPDEVYEALARNDVRRAGVLAAEALDAGARHPLLYSLAAFALEEEGRLTEAFRLLTRALELAPEEPDVLHGIGVVLFKMGRSVEAMTALDAALLRRPKFPPSLHYRALALESLGEDQAALDLYREAADLDPAYPDPRASLAALAARRGDYAGARAAAAEALGLDPASVPARLALARCAIGEGRPQAAEASLQALSREPGVWEPDRAAVLGLLGEAFHAQNRPGEAAGAWTAAKRAAVAASQDLLKAAPRALDEATALAEALDRGAGLKRFAPSPMECAAEARGLIFLVGFPRSGTTLLGQILEARGDVCLLEERATLEALEGGRLDGASGLERLQGLSEPQADALRSRYWEIVRASGLPLKGRALVDKLPLNALRLPIIARLFPSSKVLFAVRDPRDVVFSAFRRIFRMNPAMREFATPASTAHFYDAVMTAAFAARRRFALDWTEVRYEALVEDFDQETLRLTAALGLPPSAAMADFAALAASRPIATPSAEQVRRGLYREGVGQWRTYAPTLAEALKILDPWVDRLGYRGLAGA